MYVFNVHTNVQGNGHSNCRPQGETTTNPLKEKNKQNTESISMSHTKFICKMWVFNGREISFAHNKSIYIFNNQ